MSVQRAKWDALKTSNCMDAAGIALATKWFHLSESDIEAAAGRYVRGKNQGKLRGWIVYMKCREGGWSWSIGGGVVKPGMIFARFEKTYDDMCNAQSIGCEKFLHGAKRVDSCYGHSPAARSEKPAIEEKDIYPAKTELDRRLSALEALLANANVVAREDASSTIHRLIELLRKISEGPESAIVQWYKMETTRGCLTKQELEELAGAPDANQKMALTTA